IANVEVGVMIHLLRRHRDAIDETDSGHERRERERLHQRFAFPRPAVQRPELALDLDVRQLRSWWHHSSLAVLPPCVPPAWITPPPRLRDPARLTDIISATTLTAISSGVSAPIESPTGACTFPIASSVMPHSRRAFAVSATLR